MEREYKKENRGYTYTHGGWRKKWRRKKKWIKMGGETKSKKL
jgi:hypothetical protein